MYTYIFKDDYDGIWCLCLAEVSMPPETSMSHVLYQNAEFSPSSLFNYSFLLMHTLGDSDG